MTQDKIEVVSPFSVSQKRIDEFVQQQQEWILKARLKVEDFNANIKKITPEVYRQGVLVPYQGRQLKLHIDSHADIAKLRIDEKRQIIRIKLPNGSMKNESDYIKQTISTWMKEQACKQVVNFVELHASRFNLYPRKINIKSQKSRWGSCGIHNDINLNWLLILAPVEVLEYVVVHELCHIKERNHSANFWRLVEMHLPDYKQHRNWLKQHGASLMQGL